MVYNLTIHVTMPINPVLEEIRASIVAASTLIILNR